MADTTDGTVENSFCTLEDVEIYMRKKIPAGMVDYAKRKMVAASDVLRRLCREEGRDLDKETQDDGLTSRQARDTVAASVAIDLSRSIVSADADNGDNDLSNFKQFTQSAGGYSFTGVWAGHAEDVFFTENQLQNMGIGITTVRKFRDPDVVD